MAKIGVLFMRMMRACDHLLSQGRTGKAMDVRDRWHMWSARQYGKRR